MATVTDMCHQLMTVASAGEPTVDFLLSSTRILRQFMGGAAIEIWLREPDRISRWELSASPERFYRYRNVPPDLLDRAQVRNRVHRKGCLEGLAEYLDRQDMSSLVEREAIEGYACVAIVPLRLGGRILGLLLAKDSSSKAFPARKVAAMHEVARTLSFGIEFHKVQLAQRERVKELTCLYGIGTETIARDSELSETLGRILMHIPAAWQYPEVTAAEIELDGVSYATEGFGEARRIQRADIVVSGTSRGRISVAYVEERPELDEGPFLVEERRLLDTVAREISILVANLTAEQESARLQEQLRHSDRLATIGQLAAGVAHELNEPLGGILGFAQLAMKHPGAPDPVLDDLRRIEAAALHARDVIRKLMLFARQSPPSSSRIRMNDIVRDCFALLGARCDGAGIATILDLDETLPEMVADPSQMNQILVNLVVNATQSMPEGGTLTIRTRHAQGTISISVEDTGAGIPPEVLGRIFDPFFTTKDVREGTGLGLAVVHGIVTAHGGEIHVQSQVGRGSRFEVALPLAHQNRRRGGSAQERG